MEVFFDRHFSIVDNYGFQHNVRHTDAGKWVDWKVEYSYAGSHGGTVSSFNPFQFDINKLKDSGIWDELPKEVQTKHETQIVRNKVEVSNRMRDIRKHRRNRYSDYPKMLTCKCGRQVKANYTQLQKKADKKKVPLQVLIDGYQCQTCNPTKGRKKKN